MVKATMEIRTKAIVLYEEGIYNWLYKEEYLNADCTSTWNVKDCGYGEGKCMDTVGCCKESVIFTECQGNTIYNQTKNSCIGELKDNYNDCSLTKDAIGQSLTCFSNSTVTPICITNCNVGDVAYKCVTYASPPSYQTVIKYQKHICKASSYSQGFKYWVDLSDYSSTCPVGATCYNPGGKCEGPKTTNFFIF